MGKVWSGWEWLGVVGSGWERLGVVGIVWIVWIVWSGLDCLEWFGVVWSPNYFCVQILKQNCSDSWTRYRIFWGTIPYLFWGIKVGKVGKNPNYLPMLCCCTISFYFPFGEKTSHLGKCLPQNGQRFIIFIDMKYSFDTIDEIVDHKSWSDKQKLDELLRIDCLPPHLISPWSSLTRQ